MKVDIIKVTFRHHLHQTVVETQHTPNLVERFFGRKTFRNYYLGHKTVWFKFPEMKPITNKADLSNLAAIELKFKYAAEKMGAQKSITLRS